MALYSCPNLGVIHVERIHGTPLLRVERERGEPWGRVIGANIERVTEEIRERLAPVYHIRSIRLFHDCAIVEVAQ